MKRKPTSPMMQVACGGLDERINLPVPYGALITLSLPSAYPRLTLGLVDLPKEPKHEIYHIITCFSFSLFS